LAKDAIGNVLQEGHLVQITLDSALLRARIKHIQTGGLLVANSGPAAQQTPGMIVVNADILVPFNPQNPQCPSLLRLVDPEEEKVKAAVKM
jgi:hypothetical protein